ncbi:MAG TPA: amino acid racemase [Phycisphaerales bacterium]|nr:amino acid racemase [Phycisphaerales bacterium]
MSGHIGIAGVSPEGAALFCQALTRQLARQAQKGLDPREWPRVTLHNEPFGLYLDAIQERDWMRVGALLRRSADKLAGCGASFCVTPDNAVQHGIHVAEVGSPIPWVTIPELVADALVEAGCRTVGIIGTKMVTTGSTYQTMLGLRGVQLLAPEEVEIDDLDRIIFSELIYGLRRPESQARVLEIVRRFADRGCEGVILGCSEAPLVITPEISPISVYDAAEILALGAIARAVRG